MTVSEADLDELIRLCDQGRQSWIEGRLGFADGADVDQDADMTIFGPFGGEAVRGTAQLAERQPRAVAMFEGGTGRCDVVKIIVEGDIAAVVMIERNEVRLRGREGTQAWNLRTTSVFRHTEHGWVRLHRHADPLSRFRSPDETFGLARD